VADETGLFIEDLKPGLEVPGGRVGDGLEITPTAFEARFGRLFWRPEGSLDPIFFNLAAFCKTTAISENSPANLGAKNVLFRRPPTSLEDEAHTTVLGRKFREAGATTGVCQVRSRIGPAEDPSLVWTRECVVHGRKGWSYRPEEAPADDREKIAVHFAANQVTLPETRPQQRPQGALCAEDFRVGATLPTGRIAVLRPDEIFWITRGLGNLAKTHYTRDSGYIVWGLLTLLYGTWTFAPQLRCSLLLGMDVARHVAPVYLTEQLREEEHASETPEAPEFLSTTLTTKAVEPLAGSQDLVRVTAALDVYNNVNGIGRAEYARQSATKALASIGDDGRLLVGQYVFQLAVPK